MNRWIKSVLLSAKLMPSVPHPLWDNSDARSLTNFLESTTGRKLKAALVHMTSRANATAVASSGNIHQACGYACGFSGAVASIQSLAMLKFNEAEKPGSESDLEHLNP